MLMFNLGQNPVGAQEKMNPLFQNNVALYFEFNWKRENVADISFWCFIKLKN